MSIVVVAGATGNLGTRIARALVKRGAAVRALVRETSNHEAVQRLRSIGATPVVATLGDAAPLRDASCVVSALSGLDDTIVEAQTHLVDAAVAAGVPRFIPSDYSLDFTKLPDGGNRNLDLRRAFHARLEARDIAATTIFCGMFTDLLVGPAPLVLTKIRRVLYWQDADQAMDFTTMDDAAAFTAAAALDESTPRFLRIAGDVKSARGLAAVASAARGVSFELLRGGSLSRLEKLIWLAKKVAPMKGDVYPPWQGMQYLRDMFDGRGKLTPLDNDRYRGIHFTPVRAVLEAAAPREVPLEPAGHLSHPR